MMLTCGASVMMEYDRRRSAWLSNAPLDNSRRIWQQQYRV